MMLQYGMNKVRGGDLTCARDYDWRKSYVNAVLGYFRKSLIGGPKPNKDGPVKVIRKDSRAVRTMSDKNDWKKIKPLFNGGDSCSGSKSCFRCGRDTHWKKDCYARTHAERWKIWDSGCKKCGRDNHEVSGCYAKTDVNGNFNLTSKSTYRFKNVSPAQRMSFKNSDRRQLCPFRCMEKRKIYMDFPSGRKNGCC